MSLFERAKASFFVLGGAVSGSLCIVAIALWTGSALEHAAPIGTAAAQDSAAAPEEPTPSEPERDPTRFDRRGRIIAPPADENYRCEQPRLEIPREAGCANHEAYPGCRWQIPDSEHSEGLYRVWRNTTPEHRWGRAGLVSLVLATAAEYQRRWPGEVVSIGDLDAPGPRHQTHDRGVDVDLYLEHAMIARNIGRSRYPDNYEGRSRREVRLLRARVMDLAKILATCAGGQIRIYYNDWDLIGPFRTWFRERGLHSDVGRPMRAHNPLHRFHFHLTIPEEFQPLPTAAR